MNGFELTQEHSAALDANGKAISAMTGHGTAKAEKEAAYNVALATAIAELRADGEAASIVEKLAKGRSDVARAFVDWQCEEALYKAAGEHVQLTKRRADAIRDLIAREWAAAGGRA